MIDLMGFFCIGILYGGVIRHTLGRGQNLALDIVLATFAVFGAFYALSQ